MGSGRGDRNQLWPALWCARKRGLQWGPVVVTGISVVLAVLVAGYDLLQWGPVVVTGISSFQWCCRKWRWQGFNGVRSW